MGAADGDSAAPTGVARGWATGYPTGDTDGNPLGGGDRKSSDRNGY